MRTAVVLPAPFGPEQAEHGAGRRGQVDAVERPHLAVGLDQALGFDRGSLGHAPNLAGAADGCC